jgi:hypothetical protein
MICLQGLEKHLYIVLGTVPANAELSDDLIDNLCLGGPLSEKCEDSRSDEVEVEHLTLSDIKDDCTVLAVGAAHCVRNSVHLEPHLLAILVHSDTLGWLNSRNS